MTQLDLAFTERVRSLHEPDDEPLRRILDAALGCFVATGFRQTTMNRIADVAGLGVATVYRRFPRKEQLAQAVLLREAKRFIDEVDTKIAGVAGVEEQLAEGFAAFVSGIANRPMLLHAMRGDAEVVLPMVTEHGAPVLALGRSFIASVIRRWQAEAAIADFDADLVAEIFARIAQSLVLTPDGLIPAGDKPAARRFARVHLLPLLHPLTR